MHLSDEDYGILYNAIEAVGNKDHHYIQDNADSIKESLRTIDCSMNCTFQHAIDFASFIILSEGRELP